MLFFSALGKLVVSVATFIIERWRVFLPLAIVALIAWQFYSLTGERDDAVKALTDHLTADRVAKEKRASENATKDLIAKSTAAAIETTHRKQIQAIRTDYENLQHKYSAEKSSADLTIAGWRERVRLELARNTAAGLYDLAGNTQGLTQDGRDCDAASIRNAYDTLELACKITTVDYNVLSAWAESNCRIYGCKKNE